MYANQAPAPGKRGTVQDGALLVRLPNHLGDACMALPAIGRLARADRSPVLAGRPWAAELFAAQSWPVLALPAGRLARVRALRRCARERRARRALLLTNSFSSALEMRLSGLAPEGYATDGRSWLLHPAHRIPPQWPEGRMHTAEYYWFLAGCALGLGVAEAASDMPDPQLALTPEARSRAQQALRSAGIEAADGAGSGYVVLCPAAVGLHRGRVKRWDGFARLCAMLHARGAQPVVCPGPGEREAVREAAPLALVAGPLDVLAFAALLAGSRLVVANDSGASHLAAAAGAQILTVIGVTDPARTAARGVRAAWIGSASGWPRYEEVEAEVSRRLA